MRNDCIVSREMIEILIFEPPATLTLSLFERNGVKLAVFTSEIEVNGESMWVMLPTAPPVIQEHPDLLRQIQADLVDMGYILDQPAGAVH